MLLKEKHIFVKSRLFTDTVALGLQPFAPKCLSLSLDCKIMSG